MIRLAIATVVLLVALVYVKRRQRKGTGGDGLRITSRTGISRGVLAAVLEVEERRFLVTITASSTTLVAELGGVDAATAVATAGAATLAGPVPVPNALAHGAHALAPATPAAFAAPVAFAAPPTAALAAEPAPAGPGAPAAALSAASARTDPTFLERIRARTVRSYDPALAGRPDAGA